MGIAVFSGMIGVTFFGLLLTPVFFVVLRRRYGRAAQASVPPVLHGEEAIAPAE